MWIKSSFSFILQKIIGLIHLVNQKVHAHILYSGFIGHNNPNTIVIITQFNINVLIIVYEISTQTYISRMGARQILAGSPTYIVHTYLLIS